MILDPTAQTRHCITVEDIRALMTLDVQHGRRATDRVVLGDPVSSLALFCVRELAASGYAVTSDPGLELACAAWLLVVRSPLAGPAYVPGVPADQWELKRTPGLPPPVHTLPSWAFEEGVR